MKKPYPKNGLEQDVTYARDIYCYTSQSGLTKWVKRQMNKRFRRRAKKRLRRIKNRHAMKKHSKEWARNEIMKSLPIYGFFKWYADNYPGYGFDYWADEVLEMRDEGLIEIDKGVITKQC